VAEPQTVEQLPQCAASVTKLLQIPGMHSIEPAGQLQVPFTQDLPLPHVLPHTPQLLLSFVLSVHITPVGKVHAIIGSVQPDCTALPLLQPSVIAASKTPTPQLTSVFDAMVPMVLFGWRPVA
jgi:hypothetical protein